MVSRSANAAHLARSTPRRSAILNHATYAEEFDTLESLGEHLIGSGHNVCNGRVLGLEILFQRLGNFEPSLARKLYEYTLIAECISSDDSGVIGMLTRVETFPLAFQL